MENKDKCAVYTRYSSDNQKETSIEDQIRICEGAAQLKRWEILTDYIFADKAQPGTRVAPREAFKEMMKVAISGKCPFNRIIVDSTSRIARNTRDALDTFSLLSFCNIHIYYVSQDIDTSVEGAEAMITVNGLIDSFFIRNLRKETRRGIEGKVLSGYSGGGRRYGYRSEPVFNGKVDIYGNLEADGYRLKIDPLEADTVTRIFRLFGEERYSAKRIAHLFNKELKEKGEPKPSKGGWWSVSSILGSKKMGTGILNNELYVGRYYWNRTKSAMHPMTGKKKKTMNEKDQWVLVLAPHLRIITDEIWTKAKERQRTITELSCGRYTKGKAVYSYNLFTGLISCNECGGKIVVVSGGKYGKYGCSNNWNKGSSVCGNDLKISKNILEEEILGRLRIKFSEESIHYIVEQTNSCLEKKLTEYASNPRKDMMERELKKTERELENVVNAITIGIFSEAVKKKLVELENRKQEIMRKMNEVTDKKMRNIKFTSYDEILNYLGDISKLLHISPILGREFLSKVISGITLNVPDAKLKVYTNASV
jgi:DNA invertase Pin-like site-specific DNA recombinase/uncharacterized protein (UPF0333 family)